MNLTNLNTADWVLIGTLTAIVVILIAAFLYQRKHKTEKLRSKFGATEYDRTLEAGGNRRQAEAKLDERTQRVVGFHVRPISAADRTRFDTLWRGVQSRFVEGPAGAIVEADQLLGDVMTARGYPVSNFEQRAADLSVDYPLALDSYRTAHDIALRQKQGQAGTEDLRQAMVQYRILFEALVNEPLASATAAS